MSDPLLSISHATKQFRFEPVLHNIDLQISEGDFVSILGSSGSGKTTLLRLLAGLEKWTSIQSSNRNFNSSAFVFQDPNLLPWRTVLENVLLPLELAESKTYDLKTKFKNLSQKRELKKQWHQQALEVLGLVQLDQVAHLFPHELSGGMKMRTSLARALITKPQLLFMDEPFSALDEPTRENLQEHVHKIWNSSKTTIVFVTHSIPEAVFLSNRIILLSQKPSQITQELTLSLPKLRSSMIRSETSYFEEVNRIRLYLNSSLHLKEPK